MAYAPFNLSGKVALVTGGNRGIGLGMAKAMAEAGADIVIWGSNPERNLAAEKELTTLGVRVKAQTVDVSDEAQVREGMEEAVAAMGRVDSVFANAGIGYGSPSFVDMKTETYRKVLSVNLDGVFFTLREACRHMIERAKAGDPGGSLVGIASLAAIEGAARNQAYAATKGAVISMIKSVAVEHARYGVRANAILPGAINTPMLWDSPNIASGAEVLAPGALALDMMYGPAAAPFLAWARAHAELSATDVAHACRPALVQRL